jgi:hypothetical protein
VVVETIARRVVCKYFCGINVGVMPASLKKISVERCRGGQLVDLYESQRI